MKRLAFSIPCFHLTPAIESDFVLFMTTRSLNVLVPLLLVASLTVACGDSDGGKASGGGQSVPSSNPLDVGAAREEGYDGNCDGTLDDCTVNEYDGATRTLTSKKDKGCDGTIDICRVATYDDAGNMLTVAYDQGCDGKPENDCQAYTYDADGNELTVELDPDCDGTVDACIVDVKYDGAGNLLEKVFDSTCSGAEMRLCYEYEFDVEGHISTVQLDQDCDGTLDRCIEEYTYDSQGNVATETQRGSDGDCTVSPERCWTYTYDEEGRVLTTEFSYTCDSGQVSCQTYQY